MSNRLELLAELQATGALAASPSVRSTQVGLRSSGGGSLSLDYEGFPLIEVRVKNTSPATVQALRAHGGKIINVSSQYRVVTLSIDPAKITELASDPLVEWLEDVLRPYSASNSNHGGLEATGVPELTCGSIISEADTQLNVENARTSFNIDGSGVLVGILSDSYSQQASPPKTAAQDVASGDLPGSGNPCGRTTAVNVIRDTLGGKDEGRAMLQAVHDLAPGAPLAFSDGGGGQIAFGDQITALRTAGAKIIADDLQYPTEPMFQDGPVSVAYNSARAAGVTGLSMAFNTNLKNNGTTGADFNGYEAPAFRANMNCPAIINNFLVPAGGATFPCHDFSGNGTDNSYDFSLAAGGTFSLNLQWAQPWYGVTTDLDLWIVNGSNTVVQQGWVRNCGNPCQSGSGSQAPSEYLTYTNNTGSTQTLYLYISKTLGTGTPRLKFVFDQAAAVTNVQFATPGGSDSAGATIYGHNGAASVITIGATRYNDGVNAESYSSHGPVSYYYGPVNGTVPASAIATVTLSKPDVTATDGTKNTFFGSFDGTNYRFFGASEATPHAAGVAALMKQHKSDATPDQIKNAMQATATAMNGGANVVGSGRINAAAALGNLRPIAPIISNPTETGVNSSSATIGANVVADGGIFVSDRGIVYSTNQTTPTIANATKVQSGTGMGVFTVNLSSLSPNTTYYWRAYATNSNGTSYTVNDQFTTTAGATAPLISSPTSSSVTSSGATLGGNVTSDGGANITERGVVLARTSQDSTPTIGEAFVQQVFASGTTGVFTVSSPALNANTQYSYSAYAKNSVGTSYTTPATFTTLAGTTVPTVINPSQTSITQTSALLGGTATSDGGAAITARGVVYSSTNSDPDIGESGVVVVAEGGTGGGTFTTSVGGLSPNTTYYFKAYATNSVGTGYTFVGAFTTDAPAGSPPTLITPTYTGVTSSNATLGGNITSSGSSAITERGVVFAKSSENGAPIVGGPNTTKVIAGGTATGVFTTGVSGLQAGVQYSFRAYAINGAGTATSPINTFSTTPAWTQTVGRANDVGIGANGTVFVVGTDARPGGYGIYQWNGSGWTNIPGAALRISVGPDGSPWIVNDAGLIYHRVGGVWQLLPGRAKDIGVGADGSVFVIGVDVRPGGYGVYQWNGSAWVNVPGAGIRIAVGPDGTPWLVNDAGQIYHRVGGVWQLLPGRAKDIAVSAVGAMWVIGNNAKPGGYGVFRFNGTSYDAMPGAGINIAVGPTGTPWLTNDGSVIYRGASIQPNPSDAPDLPVQQ